ncbi:mutator transposable element-related protein [Striga asiatica]|uniref:Mutator transposable element-related protein n=1 Tax=Striga asiatica TaxID=4170 RepID=A0A5A7PUJ6_STRAF|nr:mutator transposable element-related protein [Striga asiatica]
MPIKCDDRHYQINCYDGSQFTVDFEKKICSCRVWDLGDIPCKHACSAIIAQKLVPVDFVDSCYSQEYYRNVYRGSILGTNGPSLWRQTLFVPPLPPNFGRGASRPLKARRRDQEEPKKKGKKRRGKQPMKMKRQQPTVRCKKCGMAGHNVRSCEKRKEKEMNTLTKTKLERKRVKAATDRGKRKRPKKAPQLGQNNPHNHEEEDEELQSLCELIDEYEIPKVSNQPGSTPYQQLQSSMQSRDEN